MRSFKKNFSGLSLSTFFLTFASLFADVSTEMLYPVLPVFLTQVLGAPATVVGLVEGVATATQNIVQGFSGWLADKLKEHKKIALAGYFLAALSKPFIGLSIIWPQVLGARFFDRLGTGIRSAPRDGLITASADEKHRGKAFGLEGIGDNLGAFIGPLIAALLLFVFLLPIRWIFYLTVIPGILAVLMISLVKEKKKIVILNERSFVPLKMPKEYWKYIFVTALFGIGNFSNAFLILRTKQIGIPLVATIIIYAFFNLVAALSSFPAGALSDKFGRKNILFAAFIVFIITYIGFALSTSFFVLGFLFILYGIFSGAYRAVGKALASDFVRQEFRATAIGIFSTTIGLSGLIASLVAGSLWTAVNPSAAFLYGAFFALLGTAALLMLTKPKGAAV